MHADFKIKISEPDKFWDNVPLSYGVVAVAAVLGLPDFVGREWPYEMRFSLQKTPKQ